MARSSEPPETSQTAAESPGEEAADLSGRTLSNEYRLLRRLGQGGMGQVYLAEQLSLRRKVAVKLLRSDVAPTAKSLERFKQEAHAVARATHANIVQVYDIKEDGGLHYMALEYVEGRNLRQYLEKKGPPDVMLALSIIRQVAAALQRASELGIVHRDIKPENILLTRKGEVKVADFGLSRCFADDAQPLNITQSGVAMGTPLYMAPEQVEGKPVDQRTDVYSFGVTCYHLLAGQPPFRGASAFEVAVQHVQKEPAPLASIRPDLPPELCALVHKMMAKKPENRYQTGREIVRDAVRVRDSMVGVTGAQTGFVVSVGPTPTPTPQDSVATQSVPQRPRRSLLRWAAPLLVLLGLGAGLGLGWWHYASQPPEPAPQPQGQGEPDDQSAKTREKRMLERVKDHVHPKDADERSSGLKDRIALGVHYLKERRLDEAQEFFKSLEQAEQVKCYQVLGTLGQGMVLAFQDRPKESVEAFKKVVMGKPLQKLLPPPENPMLNASLRVVLAEALEHNRANGVSLPTALDQLRRPPSPKKGPKG